jgi:hypothetical protein
VPLEQVTKTKGSSGRYVVVYRDAKGRSKMGIVRAVSPRPASPVLSAPAGAITGGTLNAGTYWYRVSAVVGGIEGLACAEQSGTVASGTTGSVVLTWAAVTNATSYKVYGRTQGGELLLNTVTAPTVTYTDTNADTPSGALPTPAKATVTFDANTTGYAPIANVAQGVALRGSGTRYFRRLGNPAGYTRRATS